MSDKAVTKAVQALKAAVEGIEKILLSQGSAQTPKTTKAASGPAEEKKPKAAKPKTGGTIKDQAQAALDAKKFHHKSKEAAFLKSFVESKADGRSAEGREMAAKAAGILGLPAPKKPGPKASAKAKVEKTEAKAEAPKPEKKKPGPKPKAPKAEVKAEAPKAPKSGGTIKDQAQAALDAGKFDGRSKEAKSLRDFVESKVDGRSAEGRQMAVEVCKILGLPEPKKPGPKASAKPGPKPKAEAKVTPQGKAEEDEASAPKPSPKKSQPSSGAKPRAIDAVEMVLRENGGVMNAAEVVSALEAKGWLPTSNDPKNYISFILSQNKEKFEKGDKRGYYRLGSGSSSSSKAAPVAEPAVTEKSNGASNGKHEPDPEPEASSEASEAAEASEEQNPFDDDILSGGILG